MNREVFIAFVFVLFSAMFTKAAVPEMINYQGYLKQNGVVVSGTKSITFSLYDALSGGALLCSSGAQSVTVTNGLFSYKVGSAGCELSTINWDNPVYIEVAVDGVTMTPREQVAGMSYLTQTLASEVVFTPAGNVAATDAQTAIAELDTEKLGLTGGTVTGTITATAFVGDGSGLTGISAAALDHNTLSNPAAGDVHTQYFNLSQSENVAGIPAFNGGTSGASAPFTADSTFLVTNLNADLLDGNEATAFMTAGTDNWVNITGDTMTGALTLNNAGLNMSGANGDITFDNAGGAISNSTSAVQIADDLNVTGAGTIGTNLTVDTNTLYVDSTNNRVGIGTNTPGVQLHVYNPTSYSFIKSESAATNAYLVLKSDDANEWSIIAKRALENGIMQFYNGSGNYVLTMNKTGEVGIMTAPINDLDVNGNAAIGTTYAGGSAAPANGLIVEGDVGIGTSSPSEKLYIQGSAGAPMHTSRAVYHSTAARYVLSMQ